MMQMSLLIDMDVMTLSPLPEICSSIFTLIMVSSDLKPCTTMGLLFILERNAILIELSCCVYVCVYVSLYLILSSFFPFSLNFQASLALQVMIIIVDGISFVRYIRPTILILDKNSQ
ncbi:uncharacterized protein BDW43DRAFT_11854 [Aspergillus alliaceus]|uniref:uncharacterized protein n=1 Tax=Petromyces alliaceus TaxID=209559 RepID=UPI0012A74B32|nr:uncharacterized protein BDW43DRAFT_11854 [Aspergillus alliaceus]KAB8239788.1 hypothetical protein BDW43DRAFT_11854 [Aspergillus alliaceus]